MTTEDDWQKIENAPKNGTKILIGWFELPGQKQMETAWWSEDHKRWMGGYIQFTTHPAFQPTHWMPLPDPPEQKMTMTTQA